MRAFEQEFDDAYNAMVAAWERIRCERGTPDGVASLLLAIAARDWALTALKKSKSRELRQLRSAYRAAAATIRGGDGSAAGELIPIRAAFVAYEMNDDLARLDRLIDELERTRLGQEIGA